MDFITDIGIAIRNFIWFLYALGFFSEIILIIIVSILIHSNDLYFIVYLVAIVINGFFNRFLKRIIKETRPKNPIKFLDMEEFKNKKMYGMPSGHSQNVFFSIVYLILTVYENINVYLPWIYVCMLIGVLTIWERWIFHNHTLFQLLVGAVIGSIFAYMVVYIRDYILIKYVNK
jgi:membrane-associated phospholipid phosphatase